MSIDRLFTIAGGATGTLDSSGTYGNNVVGSGGANHAALIFNNTNPIAYTGTGVATLGLAGTSTGDNEFRPQLDNANFAITKSGASLWILNPSSANTYAGPTTITGGALRAVDGVGLSSGSALRLAGGVLETSGTFTRAIGTGVGQVAWTDAAGTAANQAGGFAASTAPLTVNLGGSGAQVSWGTGGIGNGVGTLILSSATALSDVTFVNPINLNGGSRTIQVDDNGTSFLDYATVSGVISGTGAITKTGGGVLYLTGNNTYTGNTTLSVGGVVVRSIGGGSTASSAFGDGSGILGLNGGHLQYVGVGETVNRQINLTASSTLENSGTGPLVINNLVNATAGAKTLTLFGFNTDTNIINSNLVDNGGALSVTKGDGGTWILAGNNTYTGTTTINSGFLGLSGTTMGGVGTPTGTISVSNAGLFATNSAGLTISNPMTIAANTSVTFTGTNSITYNGLISGATSNAWQIANTISGGTLTINGNVNSNETSSGRTFVFQGTGNTILNGNMTSSGAAVGLGINTSGTFTIGGAVAAGALHTSSTITQGRVIVNKAGSLNPFGSNSVIDFGGGSIESNFALTGADALTNALRLSNIYGVFAGTNSIEFKGNATFGSFENNGGARRVTNNLSGGASLTFSTNTFDLSNDNTAQTATLQGSGIYNISAQITNGGTGLSALTYSGNGALNITGVSPGGATATTWGGAATLNGGTITISGAGTFGTTGALTVNNGAFLVLDNSGTSTASRLGGRAPTFNGANFTLIGNSGAATTETLGNLTVGGGQTAINLTNNGQNLALGFGTLTINTGGYINFASNVTLGTASNLVTFSTAPTLAPVTTGLLNRATVNGIDFATYNTDGLTANTNGIQAFNAYNVPTLSTVISGGTTATVASTAGLTAGMAVFGPGIPAGTTISAVTGPNTYTLSNASTNATVTVTYGSTGYTNINSALIQASSDAVKIGTGFVTTDDLNANRSFNAMNIAGTGLDISATKNAILTLSGGGLIVSGGSNSLSVPRIALGAEGAFHINSGATLNLDGAIVSGGSGLNKNLAGALNVNTKQFYFGTTTVNNGTLKLASGTTNTLFPNQTMQLNSGATLDLNGTTQHVGSFLSSNQTIPGLSGTVVNTAGSTANLVVNGSNGAFVGSINGNINFTRLGANNLTLGAASSYTGVTNILGGGIVLRDNATLLNTSAININYGSLFIRNADNLSIDNTNRVNDAAAITMRGATVDFASRANSNSFEQLGAMTIVEGGNTITNSINTIGAYQTSDLRIASLTRTGAGSTVNFTAAAGTLGAEGSNPRILFDAPLANNTSNVIGSWAIVNSTDYAAYNVAQGVGAVGTAGYVGYDTGFASGNLTNIIRTTDTVTTLSGNTTTGLLRLAGAVTNKIAFTNNSDTLNLQEGGLLRSNNNNFSSIGNSTLRGILTAGGTESSGTRELVIYNAATGTTNFTGGATTINTATVTMTSTAGLEPGMVITNANLPVGTTILSVDSLNQVTVSQNAIATSSSQTLVAGVSNVVVNSVIADNGSGNSVKLVKSGTGVLNLTAANTYTGGTVVNQGTVNLNGSGVTIPAGGITLNGGVLNANVNSGQIDPSNAVTLNDSSTLAFTRLNGTSNSLLSLSFNNSGGTGAPTVSMQGGGLLSLTSTSPITVATNNAATIPVITGGTLSLSNAANTLNIGGIVLPGTSTVYNDITASLNIVSPIIGAGSGTAITKTGTGLLQLTSSVAVGNGSTTAGSTTLTLPSTNGLTVGQGVSGTGINTGSYIIAILNGTQAVMSQSAASTQASTAVTVTGSSFAGGVNVNAGGIILGSSSIVSTLSTIGGTVAGPVGTGTVAMASGTRMLVDNASRTLHNAVIFAGNPTFDSTGLTGATLTLNGAITTPNTLVVNVNNPALTVAMNGLFTNAGSITSITKNGLGNFTMNFTDVGSTVPVTLNNGGNLGLLHDGDGTGGFQTITMGTITMDAALPNITIGRAGTETYFTSAINKTISPTLVACLENGLTLTNNNGYGLLLNNNITLNSTLGTAGVIYSVSGASGSLQVDGLTLSGVISGGASGANNVVFTKAGGGTLVLANSGNTFGGTAGGIIDITGGYLSVASDGALGDSDNIVRISTNSATQGFRATDTFSTNRTFLLNGATNNGFEVSKGKVFTINSPFALTAVGTGVAKNDLGTLELAASNPTWDGVLTVNQGAVRLSNSGAVGTTTGGIVLAGVLNSAIELSGGVTIADPLAINMGNNNTNRGVDGQGAVRSVSGTNTYSGLITLAVSTASGNNRSATVTADAGATLNITGGVVAGIGGTTGESRHSGIGFGGAGTINLTTTGMTINAGAVGGIFQAVKFGSGTLNIQVANAHAGRDLFVKQGTVSINGAGTLGALGLVQGTTRNTHIAELGTLELNNITTNVNNRLSTSTLTFNGGNFNVFGNSSATTTETTGTITINAGDSIITLDADAAQQLNITTGTGARGAAGALLLRGDGLGSAAANGVATFVGTNTPFIGQLGGTGSKFKGILPWAIGDTSTTGTGLGFLTADSATSGANTGANRWRLLDVSEQVTAIQAPGVGGTVENVALSAAQTYTLNDCLANPFIVNSLMLNSGGSIETGGMRYFAIESGGLIAQTGNAGILNNNSLLLAGQITNAIAAPVVANRELMIYTAGNLTIASSLVNAGSAAGAGVTKSGAGTLNLTSATNTVTGTLSVNNGVLKLNSTDFSYFPNQTLQLLGGSLDLNGSVQNFNNLQAQTGSLAVNDLYVANSGGNVINTSTTEATLALTTAAVTFFGRIGNDTLSDSDIAVVRSTAAGNTADWNLYGNNTYTGATLFNGGRVQLLDQGRISGTSSIELSNATLLLGSTNTSYEFADSNLDRINNGAAITLRGAMFQGRAVPASTVTETLGALTIGAGTSILDVAEPGTGLNQIDFTFASLAQTNKGTLRVVNVDANVGSSAGGLARTFFTAAPTLTNNIIGGWALSERDFASYNAQGIGGLGATGFAGYSPVTDINAAGSSDNIRLWGGTPLTPGTITMTGDRTMHTLSLLSGQHLTGQSIGVTASTLTLSTVLGLAVGQSVNGNGNIQAGTTITAINGTTISLSLPTTNGTAGTNNQAFSFGGNTTLDLGGYTLTLGSGGLMVSPAGEGTTSTIQNGNITAGALNVGGDLYLHGVTWFNGQNDNTGNRDITIGANIVNNGTGPLSLVVAANNGRGSAANLNDVRLTGTNTYTGGTWVNSGRLVLANPSANGTTFTATGGGNMTIAGGYSGNAAAFVDRNTRVVLEGNSQIANSASVTVMGGGTLDLNGFNQTLGGLVFDNHGGDSPTVTTGTGILTLSGNVTASGQNLGSVSTISTTGVGQISLGGSTRTITVNPVTWNSDLLSPYQPNLNISGTVTGTGSEGILKAGNGILQLSGQSTFTGGVDVQAGGLLIGASSTPSAYGSVLTSGPLGTGTFNIGANTFLLSSAAANTVANPYTIGGNFSFRGTTALTLNGDTTLPSGATTITVDSPITTYNASSGALILGGVLSGTDGTSALIKNGLGTLVLNNNNTFAGGVTLNAGNLVLGGLPATNTVSPLPSGSSVLVNSDQALLSFMNNGGGSGGVITYANDVNILSSLTQANLHGGNFTANTGNVIEIQNLNVTSGQTINVSSSNAYNLRLLNLNTTGATPVNINVAGGTTVLVFNYGTLQPVNTGKGTLLFPDQPLINQTNILNGGSPIVLSGTYPLVPSFQALGTSAPSGFTSGGLSTAYYSTNPVVAGNQNIISVGSSGLAPSGTFASVSVLGDTAFANRPLGVTNSSGPAANTMAVMTGLIEITTGGTYSFTTAVDDQSLLIIDGQTVVGKNAAGGGTGIGDFTATSAGTGTITLSAGFHTITYKNNNSGSGGGYHLLYSGPDTNGNNLVPTTGLGTGGFQAVPASKLYFNNSAATAGNNYLLAAQISNSASVAAATTATIDTFGTQFNTTFADLTLNAGSRLNVVNGSGNIGINWLGVAGTTTISGAGAILNPGSTATSGAGMLNLIGGVSDSGNGLTKYGSGTLIMGNNAGNFTGTFDVRAGTVMLTDAGGLSTGINTIGSATTVLTSASTTVNNATVGVSSTAGLVVGQIVNGTNIPAGAFIESIGPGNQIVLSAVATGTASVTLNIGGASLDLNGVTGVTGNVTVSGLGQNAMIANSATTAVASGFTGALWNSSFNAASMNGTVTIGAPGTVIGGYGDITLNGAVNSISANGLVVSGIGTLNFNNDNSATLLGGVTVNSGAIVKLGNANGLGATATAAVFNGGSILDLNGQTTAKTLTINGAGRTNFGTSVNSLGSVINSSATTAVMNGTLTLGAASSIGSNRINSTSGVANAGDITVNGVIGGAFLLSKVGDNTLTLTNANTQNGVTITRGTVVVSGASGAAGSGGNLTVGAGTYTGLTAGNVLSFDNTSAASSSRAGGAAANRSIILNGGAFNLIGNGSTAVNEAIGTGNLQINNASNVVTLTNAGANIQLTAASITRSNQGTGLIRGVTSNAASGLTLTTAATAVGQAGANGAKNRAIVPWLLVDTSDTGAGVSFAVSEVGTGLGVRPLNLGTETDLAFTANNNIRFNNTLTAGAAVTNFTSTLVNSLTFEASGGLTINGNRNVTVDSGGILALADGSISGAGWLNTNSNREFIIHTVGATTDFTISTAVGGTVAPSTGGLTKAGNGVLVFDSITGNFYTGATRINGGTLQLASAAPTNALFYGFSAAPAINATATGTLAGQNLVVNAGGTFDLNGNNQIVAGLNLNTLGIGSLPGSAGIVTNSDATNAAIFTIIGNTNTSDFAGSINGNLSLVKSGAVTLILRDNNSYAGSTLLMSELNQLIDQGRLSGTSEITLNRAVLDWNDSGIQAMSNRIGASTPITMNGGAFLYTSRSGTDGSISLGGVTANSGTNLLRINVGSSGAGTASMTIASLSRTSNSGAVMVFSGATGAIGDNPFIKITSAPTLTNGMIGAWAVTMNAAAPEVGPAFATYDPVAGVRPLSAYYMTQTFLTSSSTSNLRLGDAAQTVPSGGYQVNSLAWNGFTAARALSFINASDTLTLTSGGAIFGVENFARTIGSTAIRGKLTSGGSELFLHNPENILTVNADITGTLDLVLSGLGRADLAPEITLTNANNYVGKAYANGIIVNLANDTGSGNAVTGDLIITGGTNLTTGSAASTASLVRVATTLNPATQSNLQIADTSTVTVRGGAQLDLQGINETFAALVFNNEGGGTNNPIVQTGAGILTLTGSTPISATNLLDPRAIAVLSGNVSLPATSTIAVDPVANSEVVRNGTNGLIGLQINANISGATTVNKTGNGVLGLGGVSNIITTVNLDGGAIVLGANSNYKNAKFDLDTGTILDMRGNTNLMAGTIVGNGTIKNFAIGTAGTLVMGGDNLDGTFSGPMTGEFSNALLNVTKTGTGNWNLSGDNSSSLLGNLQINGGTVTLDGASAKTGFITTILGEGGTLTLDNSTNVLNNRLGGTTSISSATADRVFSNRGGVFNYIGGATAVSEALSTVTNLEGTTTWNLTASGTSSTSINIGTVSASSTTNRGTLYLNAGSATLGGAAAGANRVTVFATTPTLVGGAGAAGTKTMSIRPDMIGIDSTGSGLVTHDSNGFRLLTASEYQTLPDAASGLGAVIAGFTTNTSGIVTLPSVAGLVAGQSLAAAVNGIATTATISSVNSTLGQATFSANATSSAVGRFNLIVPATANVRTATASQLYQAATVNSITLDSGGGLTSNGNLMTSANCPTGLNFGINGALNTLTVTTGAVVANTGNTGFNQGAITAGGALLQFHTLGNLTANNYILGSGGIVKDGSGTLTIGKRSYNTAQLFVNEGTVVLNGGANTLLVVPTGTTATVADLVVNGGTLDLNGNSQAVARVTNTTTTLYPNGAGTITNTSGTAATLTVNNPATTFAGVLAGNLALDKAGANALTLLSANSYTGATNVRGGTLELKDSATTGSGAVSLLYGTLLLNNSGLSHVTARTGTSAINMSGATLSLTPRLEGDTTATTGNVNLTAGFNTVAFQAQTGIGGSLNLVTPNIITNRVANSGATLNVTAGTGQIGRGVSGGSGQNPIWTFTTNPTLDDGIIGGWAVGSGTDFLTYQNTAHSTGAIGVGLMGDTGAGFTAYNTTITAAGDFPASAANSNIKVNGNFNVNVPGARSFNAISWAAGANGNTMTWTTQTDTLTIPSGGLIRSGNFTGSIGQGVDWGRLTQGSAELFIYNNQSNLTINSRITGANKVVLSGGGSVIFANGSSANPISTTVSGTTATVASTTNLIAGQTVTGTIGGVAYSGTIISVDSATTVTLSGSPTAGTAFLNFGATGAVTGINGTYVAGANPSVTLTTGTTTGMFVGQLIFGTGIPAGATVGSITGTNTFTIAGTTTGAGTAAALTLGTAGNSYTGGTVVNNGQTLTFTPARSNEVVVPAATTPANGLVINGGTVNHGASTTLFGMIAPTNQVTINGAGVLTFPAYTGGVAYTNTLAALNFNNVGGTTTPELKITNGAAVAANTTHRLVLSNANAITVVNDNYATTPTISGTFTSATQFGSLEFSNASPVINVSGLSPIGLVISAAITQNAGNTNAISKIGTGSLVLSNANSNWTTGLALNAGTLIVGGGNSTPTTASTQAIPTTVTAGPLGTGTLTIAAGTTVQTDNTARTIANPVVVNGNFTVGGTGTGHNLTLNGTVNLGSTDRTITVASPLVTATIGGEIFGSAGLTKSGDGILVLSSGANSYSGPTIVNGGLLKYGAANAIPIASAVSVLCGGTLDLNGGGTTVTLGSLAGDSATTGGLITTSATSGTVTLNIGNATNTSFGGAITNNVGSTLNLVKQGSSTLTLGGPNSYNGTTTITDGGITLAANNVIPEVQGVTLAPTGATANLNLNGFNDSIASLTVSGAANSLSTVQSGSGTLTLLGGVTYDSTNNPGQATISGNLSLGGTQTGTGLSGPVTRTFTVGDSSNVAAGTAELLVSSLVADGTLGTGSTGDGLTKAGAGTMQLSNTANTYTGATTINAGTLQVTKLADGGLASSIGDSTNGAANLVINGGTLSYIGSGATNGTTNRQFTLGTSGGTLDASGAVNSPMVLSSTTSPTLSGTNTARTLTLTGTNTDANTLSAGLANNGSGATSLVKNGAGTWVLTGDSSAGATPMTGTTTVNGGLLLVNNTAGSGTGSGAVTVNTGATLGGSGSIGGDTTLTAGAILSPGSLGGTNSGTLSIGGSLSLAGNGSSETRLAFGYTNATGNVGNAWMSANGANWWNAYSGSLLAGNGGQSNDLVSLTASSGTPTLTWDTGGKVTLSQLGTPYAWVMGDVLNLLDWTSLYNAGGNISGTFDASTDFDLPNLGTGLAWDTSRFVSTGAIAVIPEPGRAMLLLFGLLGLTFFRRRR